MEEVQEYKTGVARIHTDVLINTTNEMSELQKRAFYFFISKIDHNKEYKGGDISVVVPFYDLVKGLNSYGIKWKKSKDKFENFAREVSKSQLIPIVEFELNGKVVKMGKYINIFSQIGPIDKHGVLHYEASFSSKAIDYIINLKKFTRLYSNDIKFLTGSNTLELFTLFTAVYGKQSNFKDKVSVYYSVSELKSRLNLKVTEYVDLKNFKVRIVDYSIKQINEFSSIYVWYENVKEGRAVIGFKFYIVKNYLNSKDNYSPSNHEIGQFKIYEYEAYKILKNYGVVPGIIVKQIIPNLPKGVLNGYQDLFVKACIQDFEKNTNQKTAKGKTGAFVQWFCQNKVYSQDNEITFSRIRENVLVKLKTLSSQEYTERYANIDLTVLIKYGEQAVIEF